MRTRNILFFWVALYFKAMPNSRDFYKEMFLHVIPVRIKVPGCIKLLEQSNIYRGSVGNGHFEQLIIFMKRLAVPSSNLI